MSSFYTSPATVPQTISSLERLTADYTEIGLLAEENYKHAKLGFNGKKGMFGAFISPYYSTIPVYQGFSRSISATFGYSNDADNTVVKLCELRKKTLDILEDTESIIEGSAKVTVTVNNLNTLFQKATALKFAVEKAGKGLGHLANTYANPPDGYAFKSISKPETAKKIYEEQVKLISIGNPKPNTLSQKVHKVAKAAQETYETEKQARETSHQMQQAQQTPMPGMPGIPIVPSIPSTQQPPHVHTYSYNKGHPNYPGYESFSNHPNYASQLYTPAKSGGSTGGSTGGSQGFVDFNDSEIFQE